MTICSLPCRQAIGKLYGKQWTVWYSEEIPSSAGPWKLQGLPGLIVKAEDSQGIHRFELYETKNEVRNIDLVNNPNYKRLDRKKLNKFKKRLLETLATLMIQHITFLTTLIMLAKLT